MNVETDPHTLLRRLERERAARAEAESIAEESTRRLYGLVEELEAANSRLEGLTAAQRDFIGIASHELLTPLAPILGFASTLTGRWNEIADDERLRYVEAIERHARRLSALARDLLTTSKIDSEHLEPRVAEVDLQDVVARTVSDCGIEGVVIHCAPGLVARADADWVTQILTNLLVNASRYGAPPTVVEAALSRDWVEVKVRDHGGGVPDSFVPKLFEKFQQAASDSNGSLGGTGLGLYIVRGLARGMGGEAWYEPNPPRGACFAVRLPAHMTASATEGRDGWRSAS